MHFDHLKNELVFDHLFDVSHPIDDRESLSIPIPANASGIDSLVGIHARARNAAEQIRSVLLAA